MWTGLMSKVLRCSMADTLSNLPGFSPLYYLSFSGRGEVWATLQLCLFVWSTHVHDWVTYSWTEGKTPSQQVNKLERQWHIWQTSQYTGVVLRDVIVEDWQHSGLHTLCPYLVTQKLVWSCESEVKQRTRAPVRAWNTNGSNMQNWRRYLLISSHFV